MVITATRARTNLGEAIRAAIAGQRVDIHKHGRPEVAIVAAERMDELEAIEKRLGQIVAESETAAGAA